MTSECILCGGRGRVDEGGDRSQPDVNLNVLNPLEFSPNVDRSSSVISTAISGEYTEDCTVLYI